MIGDYTKTIWTESTGITPARLNNLENKAAELDTWAKAEPVTIYVNGTSGNDSNTGLTSGTAVRTIGKAVDIAKLAICANATISIAAGTYAENIVLDGIVCSQLNIVKNGTGTVQINGGISWTDGQKIKLQSINITGTSTAVFENLEAISIVGCTINNTTGADVYIDTANTVNIVNCTLASGSAYIPSISIRRVGAVYLNGNIVTGKGCVEAYNTGSLNIYGETWTATAGSQAGIIVAQATTCMMDNVSGSLGVIPVSKVIGAVLFKGNNSITGAADIKTDGGQIFE